MEKKIGKKSDNQPHYHEYLQGTRKILEASQEEQEKYLVRINDKKFIVYPNVFSPKYFRDTEFFAKNLPVKKGESVLEIGCGTGAIAITAAYKGAQVVATDINPDAVKNAKENVQKHECDSRVKVRQGNLYAPIGKREKFDVIFWNVPFGLIEKRRLSRLERAVYDPGYTSIKKFISGAKNHLKPNGKVYIGFSSTLGKLELLQEFAARARFILTRICETESQETYPVKFEVFEMKF